MEDAVQVLCAVDRRDTGQAIADRLVQDRRAACVQLLGPIRSTYRWAGTVEHADEWLLVAKTTRDAYPALERAIRELHPYDVPEITAIPIEAGSADYLGWIRSEVRA
ncbi:MAG: divalent-cation tolerance protein CutA [Candidatus Velamenicoccus archaeovorus]